VNLGLVAAAFAVDTLSLVLMSFRWRLFLHAMGSRASLWEALLAYSSGVFVCNVTPARGVGGDACRAALIPRPGGSPPITTIAASVVYDRLTDLPGFLMLGIIALPTLKPAPGHWGIVVGILLVVAYPARLLYRRVAPRISQWHEDLLGRRMGGPVAAAICCSLVIWLLDVTRIMLVGLAFGVRFNPSQASAVSLVRLGSGLVPIPAGIGVVDGALVGALMWVGLPASTATAVAIMERAIVYAWGTGLGAVALVLRGGLAALKGRNAYNV
jgi:uncharacterized membrane protein YbhN (UPF0104 family)